MQDAHSESLLMYHNVIQPHERWRSVVEGFVSSDENRMVLLLVAETKSGLPHALANIVQTIKQEGATSGHEVVMAEYVANSSITSSPLTSFLRTILKRLISCCPMETAFHDSELVAEEQLLVTFPKVLAAAAKALGEKKVVVCLHDAHRMSDDPMQHGLAKIAKLFSALPPHKGIKFIISSTIDDPVYRDFLKSRGSSETAKGDWGTSVDALVEALASIANMNTTELHEYTLAWDDPADVVSRMYRFFGSSGSRVGTGACDFDDVALFESQVSSLSEAFTRHKCINFFIGALSGVHAASKLHFDVCKLVEKCTDPVIESYEDLMEHVLLPFFMAGNEAASEGASSCENGEKLRYFPTKPRTLKPFRGTQGSCVTESDEEEYEEDFEPVADNDGADDATKARLYLLGGKQAPPLGERLARALGFVALSRGGLTVKELASLVGGPEQLFKRLTDAPEENDASDIDELLEGKLPEAPRCIKDEGLEALLLVLPCFGVTQNGSRLSPSPRSTNLYRFLSRCIYDNEALAPSMHSCKVAFKLLHESAATTKATCSKSKAKQDVASPADIMIPLHIESLWKADVRSRWRQVLLLGLKQRKDSRDKHFLFEFLWQVRQNQDWALLVNEIGDVKVFLELWHGQQQQVLRCDLIHYWRDIIAAQQHRNRNTKSARPGSSKPASRKRTMRKAYDPVDIYAKSLDSYSESLAVDGIAQGEKLALAANHVAAFLWHLGDFCAVDTRYLHPPLEEAEIEDVGARLPHRQRHLAVERGSRDCLLGDCTLLLRASKKAREEVMRQQRELQQGAEFINDAKDATASLMLSGAPYFYQRWIWVNFPLMAIYHICPPQENDENAKHPDAQTRGSTTHIGDEVQNFGSFWYRKKQDPMQEREKPPRPQTQSVRNKAPGKIPKGSALTAKSRAQRANTKRSRQEAGRPRRPPKGTQGASSVIDNGVGKLSEPKDKARQTTALNIFHGGILDRDQVKGDLPRVAKSGHTCSDAHLLHIPVHFSQYPATEQEVRAAEVNALLAGSRKQLDNLRYELEAKENELGDLMQLAYERHQQDAFTEEFVQSGEATIRSLEDQVARVLSQIASAEIVQGRLRRVVTSCDEYPARVQRHIDTLEAYLYGLKEDKNTLHVGLEEVKSFTRGVFGVEKPSLTKAFEKRKHMHQEVLQRLERQRLSQLRALKERFRRSDNRKTIVRSMQSQPLTRSEEQRLWRLDHHREVYVAALHAKDDHIKDAVADNPNWVHRLRTVFGSEDEDTVIAKWNEKLKQGRQLADQLRERQNQADVAKRRLKRAQDALKELKVENENTPKRLVKLERRMARGNAQCGELLGLCKLRTSLVKDLAIRIHRLHSRVVTREKQGSMLKGTAVPALVQVRDIAQRLSELAQQSQSLQEAAIAESQADKERTRQFLFRGPAQPIEIPAPVVIPKDKHQGKKP